MVHYGPIATLSALRGRCMSSALPAPSIDSNELAASATGPNTRAANGRRWRRFASWCADRRLCALPATPATVADYLVDCHNDGHAHNSLAAYSSAISLAHRAAGLESPCRDLLVRKTLQGAAKKSSGARRAAALPLDTLCTLVTALPSSSVVGLRDRAALTVGWWGALRGDDLAGLQWSGVEWTEWGCVLNVRGKTETGAALRRVALERRRDEVCPVAALEAWQAVACDGATSVFGWGSTGRVEVKRALSRAARCAGLAACPWSAHSLRAGLVTAAHAAGCPEADIALTTGHRSVAVLRGYIREADLQARCLTRRIGC